MTYLAVARITVGDEPKRQVRDLKEGLARVIEELHDRGVSLEDIDRECESAVEEIRWRSAGEDDDDE